MRLWAVNLRLSNSHCQSNPDLRIAGCGNSPFSEWFIAPRWNRPLPLWARTSLVRDRAVNTNVKTRNALYVSTRIINPSFRVLPYPRIPRAQTKVATSPAGALKLTTRSMSDPSPPCLSSPPFPLRWNQPPTLRRNRAGLSWRTENFARFMRHSSSPFSFRRRDDSWKFAP